MAILGQCACNSFETCMKKKKQIINISNRPKIHLSRNLKKISVGQLHRVGVKNSPSEIRKRRFYWAVSTH